jgi:heme-degrading monooxygenase HmoA
MFARVSTLKGSPDRIDEAARMLQEQAVPFIRQLSGFQGAYWLADRQTGKVLTVALWESEETMRTSGAVVEQRRAQSARDFGATVQSVEEYQVIAQA